MPHLLTVQDIEKAALDLAISARELLGLPIEKHDVGSRSSATTAYRPEVLTKPPTALEFARRIAGGSPPLIIESCLTDRPAMQSWKDTDHLSQRMASRKIKVATTPDGRADDLKRTASGDLVFGLPAEVEMTFTEFLKRLRDTDDEQPVYYLQSQDSNLTDPNSAAGDLTPLLDDLRDPSGALDIPWASDAFGASPEAMNLWVGESRSRSSMHR